MSLKSLKALTPKGFNQKIGMKKIQAIIILVCSLLVGCGGKGPQRPTYKSGQPPQEDTAALALMELNRRMAKEADQTLLRYVEAQNEQYALMAISNAWMRIAKHGNTDSPSPKEDELWYMHIRTKDLQGKLLLDEEREYRIGRNQLPVCAEIHCNEWHHGDRIILLAPWYSAYGMHGNEAVPPYTNVIIDIDIK